MGGSAFLKVRVPVFVDSEGRQQETTFVFSLGGSAEKTPKCFPFSLAVPAKRDSEIFHFGKLPYGWPWLAAVR